MGVEEPKHQINACAQKETPTYASHINAMLCRLRVYTLHNVYKYTVYIYVFI